MRPRRAFLSENLHLRLGSFSTPMGAVKELLPIFARGKWRAPRSSLTFLVLETAFCSGGRLYGYSFPAPIGRREMTRV